MRAVLIAGACLGLAACATAPKSAAPATGHIVAPPQAPIAGTTRKVSPYAPAQEDPSTRGDYTVGGLYKPGVPDSTPDVIPDVDAIPEPEVVPVPRSPVGNRSTYTVLGKQYRVMDSQRGYVEKGTASYYGKKFHGRRTSNLEVYDMYAFTAAHKTLPLPSFARVTNLDNGQSVVVRVNDRGPFHEGRIIDLSYAAAIKLGITKRGTGHVEVRALQPGEDGLPLAKGQRAQAAAMGAVRTPVSVSASPMDRLVAEIPAETGGPKNTSPVSMATTPATAPGATGASVPAASTTASAIDPAAVSPTTSGGDYRFDMRQDGKPMSADEFDRWMQSRRVRVATGRPGVVTPTALAASDATKTPVNSAVIPMAAAPMSGPRTSSDDAANVILQVASFSARGNADRALAMLHGAGIDGARLYDAQANGQQVWRLRVGPLAASQETELAARIAGLGFGTPRRVHD